MISTKKGVKDVFLGRSNKAKVWSVCETKNQICMRKVMQMENDRKSTRKT